MAWAVVDKTIAVGLTASSLLFLTYATTRWFW